MSSFIRVDKALIPYTFDVRLIGITYTMEIKYNSRHDFFTIAIKKQDGTVLTSGEKLILNKPILSERLYIDFPLITPSDATLEANRITWDNFGRTVFLYVGVQE